MLVEGCWKIYPSRGYVPAAIYIYIRIGDIDKQNCTKWRKFFKFTWDCCMNKKLSPWPTESWYLYVGRNTNIYKGFWDIFFALVLYILLFIIIFHHTRRCNNTHRTRRVSNSDGLLCVHIDVEYTINIRNSEAVFTVRGTTIHQL